MTTDWVPAQLSLDMEGRRIFDTALGIFRSCSAPRNATDSRRSLWHGRSSTSPVAAQNPLKHLAPRNRPHVTNGVSSSRHLSRRLVDRR